MFIQIPSGRVGPGYDKNNVPVNNSAVSFSSTQEEHNAFITFFCLRQKT